MYRRRKRKKTESNKNTRRVIHQKRKKQTGSFLSRYDFAYAGRDTVNQAAKVAPDVIKAAANDIDDIGKQRIDQIISQGGKERALPKLLKGAIDDVYQTSVRPLGHFEKQKLNKLKRKILR